jgi:hypothetical protein
VITAGTGKISTIFTLAWTQKRVGHFGGCLVCFRSPKVYPFLILRKPPWEFP